MSTSLCLNLVYAWTSLDNMQKLGLLSCKVSDSVYDVITKLKYWFLMFCSSSICSYSALRKNIT